MKFSDIPKMTKSPNYRVSISWRTLESNLNQYVETYNLDINPDFQREHVWTEEQKSRYVEFILKGGQTGKEILFNCSWFQSFEKDEPMVLVDGKQRINAVLGFLRNEVRAFGLLYREYEDKLDWLSHNFYFCVNDLKTRREVLQWYVDLNAGGTVHTKEEIDKVNEMIAKEG